jgi:hypothetical protein
LDEGIAASSAERALAGSNVPKVVITVPAYRAETTLERTVADIPAGIAIVFSSSTMRVSTTVSSWHGRSASTFTFLRRTSATEETRRSCYTEALRSGADIIVLFHPTTSTQRPTARTR